MNPLLAALVQAGVISQADAERINRSLDPDAARLWAEQQLVIAAQNGLTAQQARLVDLLRRSNGNVSAAALDAFWAEEDDRLWAALRPTWEAVTAENAVAMAVRLGGDDAMWRAVNERMLSWVDAYYVNADAAAVGSIPNLNLTSRTQFAQVFEQWQRGELEVGTTAEGLPQLVQALEPVFGPARSEIIASTETTRILQGAGEAAARESDFLEIAEWQTAADEIVCPDCGPLHMMQREKGQNYPGNVPPPPRHPRCRCREVWLTRAAAATPAPPEERYRWTEAAYQEAQRSRRAAARQPNAIRTLTGG